MRNHIPIVLAGLLFFGGGCVQLLGYDDVEFESSTQGGSGGSGGSPDGGSGGFLDASVGTGGTGGSGNNGGSAGSAGSAGSGVISIPCTGEGPAYIHGDLWGFWHNHRVACDAQNRWLWICQQRLGPGNCPIEAQRFQDCWHATGEFPQTSWGGDSTPTPHSANLGVCQPHQWPDKNLPAARPGNEVPCDTSNFDYDNLRRKDPFYGMDWWANPIATRHLTLKAFASGQDPFGNQGQSDGLITLSTHPFNKSSFMEGIGNHSYDDAVLSGGCLPPLTGEIESPYPSQNFGAFFWLEVPTDQPVTLTASWIGLVGDQWDPSCSPGSIYSFPPSFSYHSVDEKPWFIMSPCYDILENEQLEPGRHYLWDIDGFRALPDCSGPPESLLQLVPANLRPSFKEGTCSSM